MGNAFHLSLDVRSLAESVAFYTQIPGACVTHRDASGYVNLDILGCQLTLRENASATPCDGMHLGVNLDLAAFDALAARLQANAELDIVMPPRVVDAGTPLERKKMYLRCPTGHLVEIKGRRLDVHQREPA